MKKHLLTLLAAAMSAVTMAQVPAFPGAEGFGRYTTGGRGGKIIHVTNLNDSGTGSLRAAVNGSSKKTIVFDVSGIIELKSDLKIGANTTIAGQTAPGEGITLRYYTLQPGGDNIIVRYIRSRRGQEKNVNDGADAAFFRYKKNIIFDHCSFSWSIDEVASFYDNRDFTMQWCTIGEALNNAGHGKGAHGYGGIWGGKQASFHHNLLIHCNNRTPRFNGARYMWSGYDKTKYKNTVDAERVDFRNNVIYNWGTGGCYGGPGGGYINMVNNYYKAGPGTSKKNRVTEISTADAGNAGDNDEKISGLKSRYYISGNYVNGYGENYDWKGVVSDNGTMTFTDKFNMYGEGEGAKLNAKLDAPIDAGVVSTHKHTILYEKIRSYAGASIKHDMVDARYMTELKNGTATYKGSKTKRAGQLDIVADQGEYSVAAETRPADFDTDKDGISDAWETANGLNPNDASDATTKTLDPAGWYTNIEVYLHALCYKQTKAAVSNAIEDQKHYLPGFVDENGKATAATNSPTGIADVVVSEVVSSEYYNMLGVKVETPSNGVFIRIDKHSDGKTTSRKVFVR